MSATSCGSIEEKHARARLEGGRDLFGEDRRVPVRGDGFGIIHKRSPEVLAIQVFHRFLQGGRFSVFGAFALPVGVVRTRVVVSRVAWWRVY